MSSAAESAGVPRSVPVLTGALAAAGIAFAVADAHLFARSNVPWAWALPFTALLAIAGSLIVRFQYGEEIEALDLFEAALIPVLFAFPGWAAVAMVAGAKALSERVHRVESIKASFNIAQWMAATGAGCLVFSAVRSGSALDGHDLLALIAATLVVLVVNHVAVSLVVALSQNGTVQHVLTGLRGLIVPGWVVGGALNLAFGLLFVAAFQWDAAVMPLFFVPLLALHWASAAYAAARADEKRLQALRRASTVLGSAVDPAHAMDAFLAEVKGCFEAEAAEIALVDGSGYRTHRVPAGDRPLAPTLTRTLLTLQEPARLKAQTAHPEGWRDCLAAPLIDDGKIVGVLCTYNRTGLEGFEDGELAVLAALADDVVAALQRGALVERVVGERSKLRDIVGHASDGIFTMSVDGTVTSWNPAMEEITGHRADDTVGRADFGLLRPRDVDGGDVILERWATTDGSLPTDLQILTKAGERRWLSCSYSRSAGHDSESLIVIARDVTKVREVEHLREDFVATVSHELRTPLSPIKGWASTLLQFGDTLDPEERRAAIQSILRQSQRLERLIVNLLEVSKIEHGMLEASDADVDIVGVVERIVGDFEKTSPDRCFEVHAAGPAVARAKELWVEQIVTNLMSNAIKYSPEPAPVEIKVGGADGRVQVAVVDHGCGIPAHELDRVFERFHRVQETITQTGTGLGLYIARQLAEEMDGTISLVSAPGHGSTFLLDLPAVSRLVDVRLVNTVIELEAG